MEWLPLLFMDVKLEPCMLEYIKVQLKDEEEEVPIEALASMCHTPLPANIKQEPVEKQDSKQGSPDARLRTRVSSLKRTCAQTNVSSGAFQDQLHLASPFLAVHLGDVPHTSWRQEYLVDYRPQGKILTCMVCGRDLSPITLATIQQHVLNYHPHSLHFSSPERLCILEAWSEANMLLELSKEKTLHFVYNPKSTEERLVGIATCPAEIEVAIDSDLPGHRDIIRGNSCPVHKKTLGKQGKKSFYGQSRPVSSEKEKKKPKKNVLLENGNVRKRQPRSSKPAKVLKNIQAKQVKKSVCDQSKPVPLSKGKLKPKKNVVLEKGNLRKRQPRSLDLAKGPFQKYVPTNMAPAEIHSFTDGSFPKGFVLKLFSRAEPEHTRRKNPKSKSPTLSGRACSWKGAGPAKRNKAAVTEQNGRLKSKGADVLTLSVRVCSRVSQLPEINGTAAGRKQHPSRRRFKVEVDGHLRMDEKQTSSQQHFQAQWRERYLVDYNWHSNKRLLCLVCGKGMNSMQTSNIKRHSRRFHPDSLTYTPEERKTIVDEWLGMGGVWPHCGSR